ncbi:MAG TPA: hypothetical protein VF092_03570 [Longimicrobium sp.]
MRKLRLDVDSLAVESFATVVAADAPGTVRGAEIITQTCSPGPTCHPSCEESDTCATSCAGGPYCDCLPSGCPKASVCCIDA